MEQIASILFVDGYFRSYYTEDSIEFESSRSAL